MNFEHQHERARLQPARLREVKPAPALTAGAPHETQRRPHRTARRSLLATTRAAAAKLVVAGGSEANASLEGAQLAQQALALYRAAVREVRTNSPIALSHLLVWALQSAAAQSLTLSAAEAGLATDRGMQLLDLAAKCQGRAERASTAALAFARLLGKPGKNAPDGDALAELVRAASKPRGGA